MPKFHPKVQLSVHFGYQTQGRGNDLHIFLLQHDAGAHERTDGLKPGIFPRVTEE
jgi:hypothetical protein